VAVVDASVPKKTFAYDEKLADKLVLPL